MVVMHTPVALHGENLTTVGTFHVEAGSTVPLVLTHGPSHLPPPEAIDVEASLEATEDFWVDWAARNQSRGEWSDAVTRSLITLKALTYAPTGGIVAAPTTSLPEKLGGVRNWDYRFCWLRDATLTLLALMNAGYYDEAQAWRDWLLRAAAGSPSQLQIMYGLAGERRLSEYEVPWLPGYEQSTPVRIGNAAHGQLQLDVYGEVVDTLFQGKRGGLETRPADWAFLRAILEHLEQVWSRPDKGIWEMRGEPQHFTYSKIMAWVALDRGIRAIEVQQGRRPGRALARGSSTHPRRGLRARVRHRARELRPVVRLEESRREPAAHSHHRVPAGRPTHASAARSKPSSATCSSMASCVDTTRTRQTTGFRPAKERSSRAASGWWTRCYSVGREDDARRAVRAIAWPEKRRRPAGRGVRHRARSGSSATSRRRSRTSRSSTPRTTLDMPRSRLNNDRQGTENDNAVRGTTGRGATVDSPTSETGRTDAETVDRRTDLAPALAPRTVLYSIQVVSSRFEYHFNPV